MCNEAYLTIIKIIKVDVLDIDKKDIFAITKKELEEIVNDLKLPSFRSKQIWQWLYVQNVFDFAKMSNIAKADILKLQKYLKVLPNDIQVLSEQKSSDGLTSKLLLKLSDNSLIETVGMKHDYGNSVCISSQVGCAMKCEFCASTVNGFTRNLTAAEMLLQIAFWQKRFWQEGKRVNNIIIMGAGEPFLNYDEVVSFLHLVHSPDLYNIGFRNITISTCGIIKGIKDFSKENIPVNLAISLHAPTDDLRSQLMPINNKYKIKEVVQAAQDYAKKSKRQITYEYLLIKDVNDSVDMAKKLADILVGKLASVNIIPINKVEHKKWQRPEQKTIEAFVKNLKNRGISVTIRREMGKDIQAACGQLKAGYLKESGA